MQEKKELNGPEANLSYSLTPNYIANLAFKTATISFFISAFTQPFQTLLTRIQFPGAINNASFGMYRGFLTYAIAGQKRGALTITAKQTNREIVEERIENELPAQQPLPSIFFFSQADVLLSNALSNKSKLENSGISLKWSLPNYWKLTKVNWGSRSFAGFINFSAIGFAGDYVSSLFNFDKELYNKLAGGATSGVLATLCTTPLHSYADRIALASKVENGNLLTTTPFTMFRQAKAHVNTVGMKQALATYAKTHYLKEILVRSPQSAFAFATLFGLDHAMGSDPLGKIRPKNDKGSEEITPKADFILKFM